mgnify:CR=1 FL=1
MKYRSPISLAVAVVLILIALNRLSAPVASAHEPIDQPCPPEGYILVEKSADPTTVQHSIEEALRAIEQVRAPAE